jgi:toxin HigB-1
MIISFIHKGLELFFTKGNTKGIKQDHVKRLKLRLLFLDSVEKIEDFEQFPNFKLHKLSGNFKNHYSIWVSGNWRLDFKWNEEDKNIEVLDYVDYH